MSRPQHGVETLDLPEGKSELEVVDAITALAGKNQVFHSVFRGAGAYKHYIPAVVKAITSREEFVHPPTPPYQAEISQGVLQSIFEYQTQICELTGMDVSNASVYDGATAAAEAVFMCQDRRRTGVLAAATANPQVLDVMRTYCESRGVPFTLLPAKDYAVDPDALAEQLKSGPRLPVSAKPQLLRCVLEACSRPWMLPMPPGQGDPVGQSHQLGSAENSRRVRRRHRGGRRPATGAAHEASAGHTLALWPANSR